MGIIGKIKNGIGVLSSYALVDRKEFNTVYGNYTALLKSFDENYMNDNSRPALPIPYLDTPEGAKIPIWRLSPIKIYDMADDIGDLRVVFETIQREVFRNGFKINPKFKYKCLNCLKTFKEKPTKMFEPIEQEVTTTDGGDFKGLRCDECGNSDESLWTKPDPKNRVRLQSLVDSAVNNNEQSIIDVARQHERDWDMADNAYCAVTQRYYFRSLEKPDPLTGATKEVDESKTEIDELIRMHPIQIAMIANSEGKLGYDNNNNPVWICPNYLHRTKRLERPRCDQCGCKAFTAIIESNNIPFGLPVSDPKKMLYAKHEVIWGPKYVPDLLYGFSPILSMWKRAMSLFHQDEYLWKYFDKDRPPKSILGIASRNFESVQAFMERQKSGVKSDPYMPRPISINTDDINKSLAFIDLTPNFAELQLTELRQELRQMILITYGVTPIYAGQQQGSGLGNQGLQVTLTNRAIKWYQRLLNEKFFGQLTKRILKINDWEIVLIDSEEIDLLREEQIKGQSIDNASKMYAMGFEVWTDGNGEIVYSQFPNPEKQMMMGGMGSNVKGGQPGKVKSTAPDQEKKTSFSGEPLQQRPSDEGGKAGGSESAGFSYSNKDLNNTDKIALIVQKGLINNWTLTNMAKKASQELGMDQEEALNTVKYLLSMSIEKHLYSQMKTKKYILKSTDDGTVVEVGR